jgi:hypothetical protein
LNIQLSVDDDFIRQLRANLGSGAKASELIRDALAVYNWAAQERRNGRLILSATPSGDEFVELTYPPLDNAVPAVLRTQAEQPRKALESAHPNRSATA